MGGIRVPKIRYQGGAGLTNEECLVEKIANKRKASVGKNDGPHCFCCLGIARELNCSRRAPGYFTAARRYPHTGNGGLSWCLSSSLSVMVGLFHPGRSHGCCPGRATEGSPLCGRYLLAGIKKGHEFYSNRFPLDSINFDSYLISTF